MHFHFQHHRPPRPKVPVGPFGALLWLLLMPIWLVIGAVALLLALPVMLVAGWWWKRKVGRVFKHHFTGRHVETASAEEGGAADDFVDSYIVETVEDAEDTTPRLEAGPASRQQDESAR